MNSRRKIVPTDDEGEAAKGRIALYLDKPDLEWLAQYCGCTEDTPQNEQERCARIRFRANAALHKSGAKEDA